MDSSKEYLDYKSKWSENKPKGVSEARFKEVKSALIREGAAKNPYALASHITKKELRKKKWRGRKK
jgi:hypothetical protein